MASVVIYDPYDSIVADRVITYLSSANTPEYVGQPNTLVDPDLSALTAVPYKYWKYDGVSAIVEMSVSEKEAVSEFLARQNISTVKVLEEDMDKDKQTQGHFRAKTLAFDVPVGAQWHYTNFTFPYPISLLSMEYVGINALIDDRIKINIAPDTTTGTITSDVTASDTVINVSQTVIDNVQIGYNLKLDDGTNVDDLGYVLSYDKTNLTVTMETAAVNGFLAATPTYVKQTIPLLEDIEIDYTTASITIGATKIGGSYLPANTVIEFGYYNGDASGGKRFRAIVEFLY